MEPILVYGFPLGSSMGLVAALEWLGQPYRLSRVDMLADMKSDAYGRLNGRRETPVLITDDGRTITETLAIARWLEARDVERRISFDLAAAEADRMHQLMGFLNTGFTGAFSPVVGRAGDGARRSGLSRDLARLRPQGRRQPPCQAGSDDRRHALPGRRSADAGRRRPDRRRPLGRVP